MAGPRCVGAEFHLRRNRGLGENSTEKRVNWSKIGSTGWMPSSDPGQLAEHPGSTGSAAVNWSRYRVLVQVSQGQLARGIRSTSRAEGQLAERMLDQLAECLVNWLRMVGQLADWSITWLKWVHYTFHVQ
jgi:hypothetical protein